MTAPMASTLIRTGLWLEIAILVTFIIRERLAESAFARSVTPGLLGNLMIIGALLIVAGFILSFFGRAAKVIEGSHCAVCRRRIRPGDIYCREHLRGVIAEEEEKLRRSVERRI
jgi:hypothetical protein